MYTSFKQFILQYTRVMVLLEVLLLSVVAVLSNLFRVLTVDVSCAWPAPDFLSFFPYRVFGTGFFWPPWHAYM